MDQGQITERDLEQAVEIAELVGITKALADRLAVAEQSVKELKQDKDRALIWGITLLGTAVMAMGSWIFTYFQKAST